MQRGGLSDDSWFLHPSPGSSFLPTDETVSFQRTPQALASARQHQDAAPPIGVSPTSCTRTPADLLAILATYVGPEPALLTAIANAYTQDAGQSLLRELEIPLCLEEFAKVHMVVQRLLPHYTGTANPAPPPRGARSPHYADPQAATPWLKRSSGRLLAPSYVRGGRVSPLFRLLSFGLGRGFQRPRYPPVRTGTSPSRLHRRRSPPRWVPRRPVRRRP